MKADYQPIACGLYDQLEIWAMRKVSLEITYLTEEGVVRVIKDQISTLKTLEGVEYAVLVGGQMLRLDRILLINGQLFEVTCTIRS